MNATLPNWKCIREWDHLSVGDAGITETVAQRLHVLSDRATRQLRVPQPVLTRTAKPSLQAGQVVGVLDVPGARVEILPKIDGPDGSARKVLVHMLAVAYDLPVADSELTLLSTQNESFLEILITIFADRLLAAVRRGMPHSYRVRDDDLPVLRGKLDIGRQITRHVLRTDVLACNFDELTVDTPLTRVLKAAVSRLGSVARSGANIRKLSELAARLEFVSETRAPLRESVILDRTNTAFHRLYLWAHLFLTGEWQSTTSGGKEGVALLFPMNELFEAYVGRSLKTALATTPVHLQHTGRHALTAQGDPLFALRPDIVVDGDIVADTKWKELKPDDPVFGVKQSDVYQMLAYERAYEACRLILIYPWRKDLPGPGICRHWNVAGTDVPFEIATVDIGRPDKIQAALREIVGEREPMAIAQPGFLSSAA